MATAALESSGSRVDRSAAAADSPKRPGGTDVEGLCEVEEFNSGSIYATNEHRNLHVNSLRTPALSGGQAHTFSFGNKIWENNFPVVKS